MTTQEKRTYLSAKIEAYPGASNRELAAVISADLGESISRNTIISSRSRYFGVSTDRAGPRAQPPEKKRKNGSGFNTFVRVRKKPNQEYKPKNWQDMDDCPDAPLTEPIPYLEQKQGQCGFPLWGGDDVKKLGVEGLKVCGARCEPGKRYCPHHHRRMFTTPERIRDEYAKKHKE